jgi:hypothetical protein
LFNNNYLAAMAELYDVSQLVGKTLFAEIDVPVYNSVPDKYGVPAKAGTVKAGAPVGVVYSWVDANPAENRPTLWWVFENQGRYYYAPHAKGMYDLEKLRDQGVLTDEELEQLKAQQNKEWWEKALKIALPSIAVIVLGSVALKGLINRVQLPFLDNRK